MRPAQGPRTAHRANRPSLAGVRRLRDAGLALLDVLLGMALFALIVTIALQSVGKFRERAYETGTNSDAKQVAAALEASYSDYDSYPKDAAELTAKLAALGINLTKGTTIGGYAVNGSSFQTCLVHKTGSSVSSWSVYDSRYGKIAESGRAGGSTTVPPFCTGGAATYNGFVASAVNGMTPTPTPTPTPGSPLFSDTFSGSGALGTTETGGATWAFYKSVASDWVRQSGMARTTKAWSTNPIAYVESNQANVAITMTLPDEIGNNNKGYAIIFRAKDASNYLRARVDAGWSTDGNWTVVWSIVLEKVVNGTVTEMGRISPGSTQPTKIRVKATGPNIDIDFGCGTSALNAGCQTNSVWGSSPGVFTTETKHGVGYTGDPDAAAQITAIDVKAAS